MSNLIKLNIIELPDIKMKGERSIQSWARN